MSEWFDEAEKKLDEGLKDDKAAAEAEEWMPESGDSLRGIFLKATQVDTQDGPSYVCIVLEIDSGDSLKVWASRKLLKEAMVDIAPAPGSMIVIKYDGLVEVPEGFDFHMYKVAAEKTDPDYWDKITHPVIEDDGTGRGTIVTNQPEDGWEPPDNAPF